MQELLLGTIRDNYDENRFSIFVKNLLNSLELKQQIIPIGGNFSDHVSGVKYLGEYKDAKKERLDILAVELKGDTKVSRARALQRNFIAKYLKDNNSDAALVAFYSKDKPDWRLSFVKMEYKLTDKGAKVVIGTPPKRYSFLVGQTEPYHTACSQLLPVLKQHKIDPLISDVEDAFSIEKVTEEFFGEYKRLFEELSSELHKNKEFQDEALQNDLETDDFAKKLLGQIVFLYFLQKKGWLGVPKSGTWGDGDRYFLRNLYQECKKEKKNYFNDYLEHLFYDTLNNPRNDQADRNYSSRFKSKIPFLNGGLFEHEYDWKKSIIFLDNSIFERILEVFDRYNFTVKEDEPLEKEVAVDPEMLGKVFENLLEENLRKGKGTYYTPREVVHYMCQESLAKYLSSETNIDVADARIAIRNIENEDDALSNIFIKNKNEIDDALASIKIVDPACGSGAFCVGMLQEVVRTRLLVDPKLSEYQIKKEAVQNSIYGVDIDPGAVEITKLRLWLSLVVDYELEDIEPLPNLDYKIMQGNSLLEEFLIGDKSIKLFDPSKVGIQPTRMKNLFEEDNRMSLFDENKSIKRIFKKYHKWQINLFNAKTLEDKKTARNTLKKIENELIEATIEAELNRLESIDKNIGKYGVAAANGLTEEDKEKKIAILTSQAKIHQVFEEIMTTGNRPFFLWHLYFGDVFVEKGGFDVVIANPPYLEARSSDFSEELKVQAQLGLKKRWGDDARYITRGADLLVYFFELAIFLANHKGLVTFITQNSWLNTDYGIKFQKFLLKNTNVQAIIDSDYKYFDSKKGPNINTVVSIFEGNISNPKNITSFARFHENYEDLPSQDLSLVKEKSSPYLDLRQYNYESKLIRDIKWGILLFSDEEVLNLITLLKEKGKVVSQITNSRVSIGQGLNLTKDYEVELKMQKKYPFLKKSFIPFMTTDDGAPFELRSTEKFLIDESLLNIAEKKKLASEEIRLFDPDSTGKKKPVLILPRGVTRHYCAVNSASAYSSSSVEIYSDDNKLPEEEKLKLWLFLNSSPAWLIREVYGRKNLGGGLLKAEATDIRNFPIYFDFKQKRRIKEIFDKISQRDALETLKEIDSSEHKEIDEIVFEYLGINQKNRSRIVEVLKSTISSRSAKSRT